MSDFNLIGEIIELKLKQLIQNTLYFEPKMPLSDIMTNIIFSKNELEQII